MLAEKMEKTGAACWLINTGVGLLSSTTFIQLELMFWLRSGPVVNSVPESDARSSIRTFPLGISHDSLTDGRTFSQAVPLSMLSTTAASLRLSIPISPSSTSRFPSLCRMFQMRFLTLTSHGPARRVARASQRSWLACSNLLSKSTLQIALQKSLLLDHRFSDAMLQPIAHREILHRLSLVYVQ